MFRTGRIVPLMMCNLEAADVTNRVAAPRGPVDQTGVGSQATNYFRVYSFLEHNQVGRNAANHFRQFLFAFESAKADVVAQQLEDHEAFSASTTV